MSVAKEQEKTYLIKKKMPAPPEISNQQKSLSFASSAPLARRAFAFLKKKQN